VPAWLGDITSGDINARAYADATDTSPAETVALTRDGEAPGAAGLNVFRGRIRGQRPIADYTMRIVPFCPGVLVPMELALIHWQK
jgi:starch phosphorylase